MPREPFYWILNMSIIASFIGVIVWLIGKIRMLPRRVFVFLWAIPFIRMLIPFGITSRYSLMTLVAKLTTRSITVYRIENAGPFAWTITWPNTVMVVEETSPMGYRSPSLKSIFAWASVVWLIGTAVVLLTAAIIYILTMREIKGARHWKDNVFLSDKVDCPSVYGVFRPRIVLPSSWTGQEIKNIILHENTHIRRKDNFWRLLGLFATAVHWFNPLSWFFYKEFLSNLEIACDESTVAKMSRQERKEYATTLVNATVASGFGGAIFRKRIEAVLSFRRITVFSAICFAVLVLVIAFALLTNAV